MSTHGLNPNKNIQNQPHIQPNTSAMTAKFDAKKSIESMVTLIQNLTNTTEELSQFAGAMKSTGKNATATPQSTTSKQQPVKPNLIPSGLEALAADAAGVEDDATIKKKTRKKQDDLFKKLMAKLSEIEDAYNLEELSDEDREIVESFFKNMSDIKTLKKELELLTEQENHLQHIIDSNQKNK